MAVALAAFALGGCGGPAATAGSAGGARATGSGARQTDAGAGVTDAGAGRADVGASAPGSSRGRTAVGSASSLVVPMPPIHSDPIPFPQSRKREMERYARRHYGLDTYRLVDPRVIVEHYTDTPDFQSTYNTFAPDHPDSELHELPNTCAHFVVDRHGVIRQLVPLSIMCRHTVGLNYTAIGIENVGDSDQEILDDPAELRASLALTRWLRCRYGIAVRDVIGHSESLGSPYHHEDVSSLRAQTHSDWLHADMAIYRRRLHALPCS
jgi:N-acetylmuramoyl-L-alanine amidase